jgi:uncharacterized MAPEG superfamily protein
MTPELQYLVWSVALTLVQLVIAIVLTVPIAGMATLAGNRETMPEIGGAAGRAKRAHSNMLESLVLFAALVLAAYAAGVSNAHTVLGAQLFFWGRVAYAVIYAVGLAWVRTLAWLVSVAGIVLILLQLF